MWGSGPGQKAEVYILHIKMGLASKSPSILQFLLQGLLHILPSALNLPSSRGSFLYNPDSLVSPCLSPLCIFSLPACILCLSPLPMTTSLA